ncbi:MAG: hypothetical protein WDO13_21605 [Verrucomicrobiota bacterium]
MATIWSNSTGTISSFQAARGAFSLINQELGRATLKNYLDYINDPSANNPPFGQFRTSPFDDIAADLRPRQFRARF